MTAIKEFVLKNGRIIDPVNGTDQLGDLLVKEGKIAGQGTDLGDNNPNAQVIDCAGKWITPGLIDMHVHLREPGQEYKETIQSGTLSAAAGGFTAVACMPNTIPVNDDQSVTRLIKEKARLEGSARVYPVGAISKGSKGESLAEFGEMKQAGVVALSDDGLPVLDSQLMRRALEYATNHNLLVISHAEDSSLSRNGVMNEGALATQMGLKGIPRAAEDVMVYRDISLAEHTGRPLHIAHVSTKESVAMIRRAKAKGLQVTAESAPHYFSLTEQAVAGYNTNAKMNPPLRTEEDRLAIIEGLKDTTLDAIATDHAPHSSLEKDLEFDQAANGIIGLETAVPLTLELVRNKSITAQRMVELMSSNPARLLGVTGGSLTVDQPADITVIDPDRKFTYTKEMILSKSSNSPFLDQQFTGKAVLTIMGGRITFNQL